ncbi:MAG: HPr family phosphocarrier protein [Lentisphaeria bacterium]|nr:HPr family phosphocarrier protein [Lentisphaeria bacterium]
MQERMVTIRNNAGIHCRPSGVILTTIKKEFPDHAFTIIKESGESAEITGMLDLISLALSKGVTAKLQVEGIDEEKAVKKIGDLLEFEFDFPPRK